MDEWALGIVMRDSRGTVVTLKVVLHNHVSSSFAAEALAYLEAIKLRRDLGLTETILEGDSFTIVKKCRTEEKDRSELCAYVKNIKLALHGLGSWTLKHVRCTTNMLADRIATKSLRSQERFFLLGSVPS